MNKKTIYLTIASFIIACIIPLFTGLDLLERFCYEYKTLASIILYLLIVILILGLVVIIFSKSNNKKTKRQNKHILKNDYKPFVLIFDDEIETLKDIDEILGKECKKVLLSDMTHPCLAECFDVIIGDLSNIGYGYDHKNASSILNEIIRKDPYKQVIAITNDRNLAIELDKGIEIVQKDSNNSYLRQLVKKIKEFKTQIIDLDEYWKNWKKKNDINSETKEIKLVKKQFYHHFEQHIKN